MSFELQGSGTYEDVVLQAKALIEDEPELVPNMANLSALLNLTLEDINWVGFYTVQPDGNLLLGPFQGKPACIRIKAGRGVCGTALAEKKTLRVADVRVPGAYCLRQREPCGDCGAGDERRKSLCCFGCGQPV